MKDVIVIPTYNEKENIKVLIPKIFSLFPNISVVVADDNSPDKTGEDVRTLQKEYPNLSLITRPEKNGLGRAYTNAFVYARPRPFFSGRVIRERLGYSFCKVRTSSPVLSGELSSATTTLILGKRLKIFGIKTLIFSFSLYVGITITSFISVYSCFFPQ